MSIINNNCNEMVHYETSSTKLSLVTRRLTPETEALPTDDKTLIIDKDEG